MQGSVETSIEGIVTGRHARAGRLYFDVNDGLNTYPCFDATGQMGAGAIYMGRPVRCVGRPSQAVEGYFEVNRLEHAGGAAIDRSMRAAMRQFYRAGSHDMMFDHTDA